MSSATAQLLVALLVAVATTQAVRAAEDWIYIGEGYSSADPTLGIDVSWRRFSAPDFPEICAGVSRAARLDGTPERRELAVGASFALHELHVVALGDSGEPLGAIPISVELSESGVALLALRDHILGGGWIRVVRPGTFSVRVRPLCSVEGDLPQAAVDYVVAR